MSNIKVAFYFLFVGFIILTSSKNRVIGNTPKPVDGPADSACLFAYSRNEGRSGLLLAWSIDQKNWNSIGPHTRFLFSDFGTWGGQKRMFDPYLFQDESGQWHCIWTLNNGVKQFAHASSPNLIEWDSQVYPEVIDQGSIDDLQVVYSDGTYHISWENAKELQSASTQDFKKYRMSEAFDSNLRLNNRHEIDIDGDNYRGMVTRVSWDLVESLIKEAEWKEFHEMERRETLLDDDERYGDLEPFDAKITLFPQQAKSISDELVGIFFEDISRAADGGVYAELIQNRDFEYLPRDVGGDKEWNHWYAWSYDGDKSGFTIDSVAPLHLNNKYYGVLPAKKEGRGLVNEGFGGIPLITGDVYDFSIFSKSLNKDKGEIVVRLVNADGTIKYGEAKVKNIGEAWKKYEVSIKASESVADAQLEIIPQGKANLAVDMISLFPRKTFMKRKNGLRSDLAKVIADLNPKFVRFPGGCVAHGDGLDNIYRWKNSIGPLEERLPMRNLWGYHQTLGLGYYEYFQFCEDIGAKPVPVLAAGVPCQNSRTGGHGQCGGIPMNEMDEYILDVLDLIEWANGDATTEWGRKRAEAGHPEPFNLKYLGIGNEDLITDIFEERFEMIFNAIKEAYPEIQVIGTVGPFYQGTDYEVGWEFAKELSVPLVDEHYYVPPGWFINNQDYYDKYPRTGPKVYLGEYAAHGDRRKLTVETALSEALYLTAVERNADVVQMTSYAPLLAKYGQTDWNPDLIYFNNEEVNLTTSYYVQKLFGQNAGQQYVPSYIEVSNKHKDIKKRIGVSVIQDQESGDYIIKLVNLLPTSVNFTTDLSVLQGLGSTATLSILKGQPSDENVVPQVSEIDIKADFKYNIPAYSLNVIRIKNN